MPTISERLRECRRRAGNVPFRSLTARLNHLAPKAKCSAGFLSNVHVGRYPPSGELISALAEVYHTTPEWLRDGNPVVDIWADLQRSERFGRANDSTVSAADRLMSVVDFLDERLGGHLKADDLAGHLHISTQVLKRIKAGEEPGGELLADVAELTGIPVGWIKMGSMYSLSFLGSVSQLTLTPEELQEAVTLAFKAKEAKVSIRTLSQFVDSINAAKGGA